MIRGQQLPRSRAGASITKACVCFGCAAMRPVVFHWNKNTGAGFST
jgi:hypothetical protein